MPAEISNESLTKEARAFHLKKRLGQHFLVDTMALDSIVTALDAREGDTVIEVGPGIGFLTRMLIPTGAHIIAVDLDHESADRLIKTNYKNVKVKHGDFLRFDLNTLNFSPRKEWSSVADAPVEKIRVVGNVPYQITGLIIAHLLGELDRPSPWLKRIENIVLTVQYEVAQRIVARPGDDEYSRVSILVSQYCDAEIIQKVPASSFYPPPEVRSAIVRLIPRADVAVQSPNLQLMRQLVEAGFRQRRKMYRNGLGFLRLTQSEIDATFARLGFDPQVRAERLSLQQFAMLADAFAEKSTNAKADTKSTGEDQSDV